MDAAGDFVVSWHGDFEDGDGRGIFGQRYNSAGSAEGTEFQVNTYTTAFQEVPSVAMDAGGDFVVAWQGDREDGNGYGIFARRFAAPHTFASAGSEFRVNTYTTSNQELPAVAMDAAGDSVVVWASTGEDGSGYGIYGQRYNAAGVAQGTEFRVNSYTTDNQLWPSVAMDAKGDFVVAWQSNSQDGSSSGIYAQQYNAAGIAEGTEFRVNSYTVGFQGTPKVAMDSAGDFVISWSGTGLGTISLRPAAITQRVSVRRGLCFRSTPTRTPFN